ncbi:MAG: hypothetical protein U9Q20_07200 [Campylobacterota bacterium]|nr:hypothetical protein [Campylobacterota bacterium]
MRRSIVLLEVIFSMALFSIVMIYSVNILFSLQLKSDKTLNYSFNTLTLETTRLYLQKNNKKDEIEYQNGILTYGGYILLDDITSYQLTSNADISTLLICVDQTYPTCQKWNLKLI